MIMKFLLFFLSCLFFQSNLFGQNQPNILWIVCEDISPTLSFYGDTTANTPHLNTLAEESMIYDHAFTTVGVCAPSRSSIITGMYPTAIGTMHMRTANDVHSWGLREYPEQTKHTDIRGDTIRKYAAVLPEYVRCFPEFLREEGYYCTNNSKTDYQFAAPVTAWDANYRTAHWRNRPSKKTPFFSVFNFGTTHESRLWRHKDSLLTIDPEQVPVPPYLQNTKISRQNIARHYSNIELLDQEVGELIKQLKEDGLYDETIIFFYSDHGGPLPRGKRAIYDSGLRVPFLIKDLNSAEKGRTNRLVSFVDLAPTILSLANIQPPDYMHGKAFLGEYETKPRQFIYASSDRFDGVTDRIRAVRDGRFLYLRNFYPHLSHYKSIKYRYNIPMMNELLELRKADSLNTLQQRWFQPKNNYEELYDTRHDPHNLHNLVEEENYRSVLNRMRNAFFQFQLQYPDLGHIPESQLIDIMWPEGQQPKTQRPFYVCQQDGSVLLECDTPGAGIAYLLADQKLDSIDYNLPWQLYNNEPVFIPDGKVLNVIAERIGYQKSELRALSFTE